MLADIPKEFRKYARNCQSLKFILKDTRTALADIGNNIQLGSKYSSILFLIEEI